MTTSSFHLVVGVDDSKASYEAVRFAATIAGQHENAKLTLVFVEKASMLGTVSADAAVAVREMWNAIDADILKYIHSELDGRKLSWEYRRLHGEPAEEIDAVAKELDADAIVVGRASHRAVHGPLGSIPVRLAHSAPVPVVIVP
ncbi:MAG TPA: universal stress protein [Mycobacteriales bacterium]|jgi:nucleotide-binding universal stress UspA family protein|nr:universal stress protein [Mycobacteriales bacterium]